MEHKVPTTGIMKLIKNIAGAIVTNSITPFQYILINYTDGHKPNNTCSKVSL